MFLSELRAENFRLIAHLSLRPHRRLNFIYGANAAGKTSLLETIYCLGRGKSFRGHSPSELAGPAKGGWSLAGRLQAGEGPPLELAARWDGQTTQLRRDRREDLSVAALVQLLPVQILEPGMHKLLQDGPSYRRSFLDWGVFHVEHEFLPTWRRFQRALRQRNQALRLGAATAEIQAWDRELVASGRVLHAQREAHLAAIRPRVDRLVEVLLGAGAWSFELAPGWPADHDYAEALAAHLARDRKLGTTMDGPHRAELRVRLERHAVRNRISRGQQKLLIAALLLAQAEEIAERRGRPPILLVDDFGAELAEAFQRGLLSALQAYRGQVFVTAFEPTPMLRSVADCAMFHVEHGRVQAAAG